MFGLELLVRSRPPVGTLSISNPRDCRRTGRDLRNANVRMELQKFGRVTAHGSSDELPTEAPLVRARPQPGAPVLPRDYTRDTTLPGLDS